MTGVRRTTFVSRKFITEAAVRQTKTDSPLPEHNGPEKPGRATAPKGTASPSASQAGHLAFAHSASRGCEPADVLGRQSDTSSTNQMDTTNTPTICSHLHSSHRTRDRVDAFDGGGSLPSNGKSPDCVVQLTRLTDLTANRMGVYVPGVRTDASAHPLGLLPAPLTTAVKSVKSVKPQDGAGRISPPCCQTGCQIDGTAETGVVA